MTNSKRRLVFLLLNERTTPQHIAGYLQIGFQLWQWGGGLEAAEAAYIFPKDFSGAQENRTAAIWGYLVLPSGGILYLVMPSVPFSAVIVYTFLGFFFFSSSKSVFDYVRNQICQSMTHLCK